MNSIKYKCVSILLIAFACSYSKIILAQSIKYDQINRLVELQNIEGSISRITYDKLGNRTLYEVLINGSQSDLQPNEISIENLIIAPGAVSSVEYLLINNGEIGAGQNSTKIYLNEDPSLSGATEIGSFSYSSIPGNSEINYSHDVAIPANTQLGPMYLLINVDDHDDVVESDETNNLGYVAITIEDCDVMTITFPTLIHETCGSENGALMCQVSGGTPPLSIYLEYPSNTGG